MKEVARAAGVSHQTVSRHLRFAGEGLKASTRERVDAAIRELGYRPNLIARSMRTRRTGRLAILLPSVGDASPGRTLVGAIGAARAAGYAVEVLSVEGGARERAGRLADLAGSGQVEGVLSLAPAELGDGPPPDAEAAVVVSAGYDDRMRGIGELADGSPVADLVAGLAAGGHRRFLHVAGDRGYASARGRRRAYLEIVERLGLESHGVADGDWSAESGRAAVLDLPEDSGVTAVIAGNDAVAAGAVRGALERGWSVPGDLSVTGWDDAPVAAYLSPALTTVAVDLERLGTRAMERLIAAVRGTDPEVEEDEPLNRVVWRESTGPAPRRGA
ncbi:LacI family DNA-binding transcriptional regulator [Nocardiopsis sp. RSe5-2]|uniref:LacI family DNA-binding transcriptional regulator n=1 Tax=Nocardiopsis endophytica TaxID=3018445 RepID=A0ABT4U1W7_9ACTN|nr:LacI family DNA-binding transcriptional regulator [Nocardiopsis endophytica]MDA2810931.1 LacI family DNA-binding transcriptional regulator [Nocardiopsis endophytica]